MEIRVLASGSKGNIISLITDNKHILIDVGISFTKINKKLTEFNLKVQSVSHVILTHEHSDHTYGLRILSNKHKKFKLFLTRGTMDGINLETKKSINDYEFIYPEKEFMIDNISIYPILISHDANEPIGLVIKSNGKKAVFISDTGYIHKDYFDIISDADFYYLEANHDEIMLMQSRNRPHATKMRILGERGHLSNNDATRILNEVIKLKRPVWAIAHISEDCNSVEKIEQAIVKNFSNPFKTKVIYTSQESTEVIKV